MTLSSGLFSRLADPVLGARANANGRVVITKDRRFGGLDWLSTGNVLLIAACLLLAGLAGAMGIVSWHAQYQFVFEAKHQHAASALEALGLDAGAVIFSILGIALARLGRRAVIERALVCLCAAGSCAMNLLGADLGSPRSVAVYVMPPVLFACGSDRLIAVIRRSAMGRTEDDDSQRSAWHTGGRALLYVLRFCLAPPSTAKGARRLVLQATPLPGAAVVPAITGPAPAAIIGPGERPAGGVVARSRPAARPPSSSGPTKTAAFLALVEKTYGPLAGFPMVNVSRVAGELAPKVELHPGSARTALKAAVLAATDDALDGAA